MLFQLREKIAAIRAALTSPLRIAAVNMERVAKRAIEDMIDAQGIAYKNTRNPQERASIVESLKGNSDIYDYIRKITEYRMKQKYYNLDRDKIEEIVDSALVSFFNNDGLERAIVTFDPEKTDITNSLTGQHKGWERFGRWLISCFWNYELRTAWERFRRDWKTGDTTTGNGNPSAMSLNEMVSPNSKFTPEENSEGLPAKTPEFLSYKSNGKTDYRTLLRMVEEELQVATQDSNILSTNYGKNMVAELEKLKGDLIEIVRVVDGEDAAEEANFTTYKMPDPNRVIGLQDGSPNRQRTTLEEMSATLRAAEHFFEGLPESVANMVEKNRFRVNKMYTKSTTSTDPTIRRKVTESLIKAIMILDTKLSTVGRGKAETETGAFQTLMKTKGGINRLYAEEAIKQMELRQVPSEVQEEVVQNIMSENELVRRQGDADEFKRHHTYDKLSEGLDPTTMTEEQMKGIALNTFKMMGYDKEGARPWGRSPKGNSVQNYLSQAPAGGYDPNEFQNYMSDEYRTMAVGDPMKKAKLPENSGFFLRRQKPADPFAFPEEIVEAAAIMADRYRIIVAVKTASRCAKILDTMGKFATAETIESNIRTASRIF